MRIVITNDDGINAPGLVALEHIAAQLAGPDGEVWVIAPAVEQSGVGHCINYTRPTMIHKHGDRRFAVEGSPADCVLTALHEILKETPPDLILSGVNRGNNAGENTLYSGTIGAAMEAALQGFTSIALSQYLGPDNVNAADPFEVARETGADIVRRILTANLPQRSDYRLLYNVNFPPVLMDGYKGHRVVKQGFRQDSVFSTVAQTAPNGRKFLWIKGGPQHGAAAPDTDISAALDGYTSITPMRLDLTAYDVLDQLKAIE